MCRAFLQTFCAALTAQLLFSVFEPALRLAGWETALLVLLAGGLAALLAAVT